MWNNKSHFAIAIHLIRTLVLHPNYILLLFINYILLSKRTLLLPKITLQSVKSALQLLKKFRLKQAKSLATLSIFIAK